jgi:N-acetylmuramoyl-L-alanine amidase
MSASGKDIVTLAKKHVGERYFWGALVPKDDPTWDGPWDCAEFASWLVFQTCKILYGCDHDSGPPSTADAGTSYWDRDSVILGRIIPIDDAAAIPGAFVLRVATAKSSGHIVVSDGKGGTIEAATETAGVIQNTLSGRRWDRGILVPGIDYGSPAAGPPPISVPPIVYRLTSPPMQGAKIKDIQTQLTAKGFDTGGAEGQFGPKTFAAVLQFQRAQGLVADGEVGPLTAKALGITL